MNRGTPSPVELEHLLQDLEDGALAPENHARLMDLMRGDPEIRRAYLHHMVLSSGLDSLAKAREPAPERSKIIALRSRRKKSDRRASLVAIAALFLMAAIIGSVTFYKRSRSRATIVEGAATQWRFEAGGFASGGGFLPSTRIAVDRGTVEITTRTLSKMLLEGPAVLDIKDRLNATLVSGRGMFDVSAADKGFTVTTERLHVVDLGTRFGVAVSPDTDWTQVASGNVLINSRTKADPPLELRTGQALLSDHEGNLVSTTYDPGLFLNQLTRQPVEIHWSFDELVNGDFPSSSHGLAPAPMRVAGFDGQSSAPRIVPGRFGAALDLTNGTAFAESDFPGISGAAPRTISLWMKSKAFKRRTDRAGNFNAPPVAIWGDDQVAGASWSLRVQCISGIIGSRWGRWGGSGWVTAGKLGSIDIFDDEWHHLVAVFTGETDASGDFEIRHYIDGTRIPNNRGDKTMKVDTGTTDSKGRDSKFRLGYDPEPQKGMQGPSNVPISIDEVRVIRAALSDRQVAALFIENKLLVEP